MNARDWGALGAGVCGFIVLTVVWISGLGKLNVVETIGAGLVTASVSALLATYVGPLVMKWLRPDWDFQSINKAPQYLARLLPGGKRIREVIVVAYSAEIAQHLLQPLADKNCSVDHLKLLIRDPRRLVKDIDEAGSIPRRPDRVSYRLKEISVAVCSNLLAGRRGAEAVKGIRECRLYAGQPVLRVVVIDREIGYFSIYSQRQPRIEGVDWSATDSHVLRLSKNGGYEERLLTDVLKWFDTIWEDGSVRTEVEGLKGTLRDCAAHIEGKEGQRTA